MNDLTEIGLFTARVMSLVTKRVQIPNSYIYNRIWEAVYRAKREGVDATVFADQVILWAGQALGEDLSASERLAIRCAMEEYASGFGTSLEGLEAIANHLKENYKKS